MLFLHDVHAAIGEHEIELDEAVRSAYTPTIADEVGITRIERVDDLIPLLFAHSNYKSYPEGSSPRAAGTS